MQLHMFIMQMQQEANGKRRERTTSHSESELPLLSELKNCYPARMVCPIYVRLLQLCTCWSKLVGVPKLITIEHLIKVFKE